MPNTCLSAATLRKKVAETIDIFPWYRKYLRTEVEQIDSILELPFITSKMLEEHYYNSFHLTGSCEVYETSGTSSGKRKKIFYSTEDETNYLRIRKGLYSTFLSDESLKLVFSDMGTGHAASTAKEIFESLGFAFECVTYDTPIIQQIKRLRELKPDILYTMPSLLDNLIKNSDDVLHYQIKKIILVGEIATSEWIKRIAQRFQISCSDILDTYGSIEIGTISTFNHSYNCYVIQKDLFAEGINAEDLEEGFLQLPNGESVLVLTSFVRKTFPSIRFVTYDVVKNLRRQMIDGEERTVFDYIVKRIGHEFKHGEKISLYDIENVIYRFITTGEVRIRVVENRITIEICSRELNDTLLHSIYEEIQKAVPQIGEMVACGKLDPIQIRSISDEELKFGQRKNKKLYTDYEK